MTDIAMSTTGSQRRRNTLLRADRIILALIAFLVLARVVFLAAAPIDTVIYRTTDDAFYYFNVARNIVEGQGVSFDGINRTNGFHPLWMCAILPIYAATSHNGDLAIRMVCCLQAVLAGGSFVFCWFYVKRLAGTWAAAFAVVALLHPFSLNHMLNGLETGLLVFLAFAMLWATAKYRLTAVDASAGHKAALGLGLGLMFLCRLDTAFVPIGLAVLALAFYTDHGRPSPFRLLAAFWPTLVTFGLVVLPYFVWNGMVFNHLMPISGALKSEFPHASIQWWQLRNKHWAPYTGALTIGVFWVIGSSIARRGYLRSNAYPRWRSAQSVPFLAVLWLGSLFHFIFAALFLTWAIKWWHFASHVPVIVTLFAAVCAVILRAARKPRRTGGLMLAATAVIVGASTGLDRLQRGIHHKPWYDAALWVRENTPKAAVLAMTDCGLFGYFNQRATINLDGVINGYEYQAALADGSLPKYLQRCGITLLADYEVPVTDRARHRVILPARLEKEPGYELRPSVASELYVSPAYHQRALTGGDKPAIQFIIWRMDRVEVRRRWAIATGR